MPTNVGRGFRSSAILSQTVLELSPTGEGRLTANSDAIMRILRDAKLLAREYRALTGKPLGVTGEVAEYEAARILGLELTPVRADRLRRDREA